MSIILATYFFASNMGVIILGFLVWFRHLTTVLFFFVLLPFESSAKQLDTAQLKTFSEFVIKETQEDSRKANPPPFKRHRSRDSFWL